MAASPKAGTKQKANSSRIASATGGARENALDTDSKILLNSVRGMRANGKRAVIIFCTILAILIPLCLSKPGRIQYHKWRFIAAKREYLRLARGEYRFADKTRELFLGKPLTWPEVETKWKYHEQALVDLGFLGRVTYYARRGKVPSQFAPEFLRISQQMDRASPAWSYRISDPQTSVTIAADKEGLDLWKKLAPSVGLQEDKPKDEGRTCPKKSGRRNRSRHRDTAPASSEWSSLFGRRSLNRTIPQ
jgi:hypothetical protein